jgi:SNF2 family DNA or RNA helicase
MALIFGSILLEKNKWKITCEAHVRSKLKRLFPEVSQRAGETISLSNNPENCRDLLWFIDRYAMVVEDLPALREGASNHIEQECAIAELLEHRRPPDAFEMALPPRDYQSLAASLAILRGSLLLADEVGLGKTPTSICPMGIPDNLPVLVVTLSHLPKQWEEEIAKFAPQLQVHILKTGKPYSLIPKINKNHNPLTDPEPRLPDVIITNYHKLHGWHEILGGLVRYVIFDEAQELRNSDSLKYAAAKYIADRARLKMGLTATPIYNAGIEFFSVINALENGVLGTREEFIREWCPSDSQRIKDPKAFGHYLRREGIMLRRTRKDVDRELPAVCKIAQSVDCDDKVFEKVKGSAMELAKIIMASQQNFQGEKFQASKEFNVMMRQATGVAKAPFVAEFVRLLLQSQKKIVLYGWHRSVYDIWLEALKEFNPVLYTGSESPKEKEESKKAFLEGDSRVIIISLRSGAGLNGLQHECNTVVFGELDWSPGVFEQCVGRVWRDGVLSQVMAYYLISEEGSDPVMADVLGIKLSQIQGVRDPDADLIEELEVDAGNVKRLAESYLLQNGFIATNDANCADESAVSA